MYLIIDEFNAPYFVKDLDKDIFRGNEDGILSIFRFKKVFQQYVIDKWVDVEKWSS